LKWAWGWGFPTFDLYFRVACFDKGFKKSG
jgi:hypothetical protein